MQHFSIDDYERESLKRELPSAVFPGRPPLWRFSYEIDSATQFLEESKRSRLTSLDVPVESGVKIEDRPFVELDVLTRHA